MNQRERVAERYKGAKVDHTLGIASRWWVCVAASTSREVVHDPCRFCDGEGSVRDACDECGTELGVERCHHCHGRGVEILHIEDPDPEPIGRRSLTFDLIGMSTMSGRAGGPGPVRIQFSNLGRGLEPPTRLV